MQSSETDRMPRRKLRIVSDDPLFGVCDRCNAGFRSFHTRAEQAEMDVKDAFENHMCKTDLSLEADYGSLSI
jgi:hypothetical protein